MEHAPGSPVRFDGTWFSRAVQKSHNAVMLTDASDRLVLVNEGFTRLTGYAPEEVLGKRPAEFLPGSATDSGVVEQIGAAVAEGRTYEGEVFNYRKDGSGYWAWITVTPLRGEGGEFQGFITIQTDITDRKHLEDELARTVERLRASEHQAMESERRAQEANRAKSVFLANMSHELRTPLNAVIGFVQVMRRKPGRDEEDREHLDIVMRSGEHLLGLINDVLSIAKIEAGRIALEEEAFDVRHLLCGLEEMFRVRAQSKGLSLLFDVGDDLPTNVFGDEGKLRQVLINVLGNAIKFTDSGGVALRVRWEGGSADFEVEDTGAGIAEVEIDTMFEPFLQTEAGRRSREGTGLGLAISRNIVRLMGGDIRVRSTVGLGTVFGFRVRLPRSEATVARQEGSRRVVGLEEGQPGYRLLVVDDRWENRILLSKLLEAVGFEVREAANGAEAVDAWRAWRPHLIWMDIRMPVMDGYEATREIRRLERERVAIDERGSTIEESADHRSCRIVALTASVFEQEREAILAAGCEAIVTKPFREEVIFRTLEEHLGARFRYDEAPPDAPPASAPAGAPSLEAARFAALPPALVSRLGEALLAGDDDEACVLIDETRPFDPVLAERLLEGIRTYQHTELLALIDEARGPTSH